MARAFSVLELLVAIAIVVAVSGLALPVVWGRTADAKLDSAVRQVGAAIIAARAESQRAGEPHTLVAHVTGEGAALVIEPLATPGSDRGLEEERGPAPAIHPWAVLPAGVSVLNAPPVDAMVEEAFAGGDGDAADAPAEPLRVAVFMPDGSAVAAGPTYLRVGERVIEITLNRWSGAASQRELPRPDEMLPEMLGPAEEEREP